MNSNFEHIINKYHISMIVFLAIGLFGYVFRATDYFFAAPGDLADARFNSVILEHLYLWVTGKVDSLYNPQFFYPIKRVLFLSDNHFSSSISYILSRLLGLDRVHAFDVFFLIGNTLNFLVAYFSFRKFEFSDFSSAVGAFVFSFSLAALPKDGWIQLIHRYAIPASLFFFFRITKCISSKYIALTTFFVAIQFYSSMYLGVFLIYLLSAYSIYFLYKLSYTHQKSDLPKVHIFPLNRKMISLFLASMLSIVWLLFQYGLTAKEFGISRTIESSITMLPRFGSYFISDQSKLSSWVSQLFDTGTIPMRHEHQMFVGIGVLLLVSIGIFTPSNSKNRIVVRSSTVALSILFAMTIYIQGHSFYAIILHIPGLSSIRAVSRIILVMLFHIAILAAAGTENILNFLRIKNISFRIYVYPLIIILITAETCLFFCYKTPIKAWDNRLNAINTAFLLPNIKNIILYITARSYEKSHLTELDAMILSQDLGIPTINGYSGNDPLVYVYPDPCISKPYLPRLKAAADHYNWHSSFITEIEKRVVVLTPEQCIDDALIHRQADKIRIDIVKEDCIKNNKVQIQIFNGTQGILDPFQGLELDKHKGPYRLSWRTIPIIGQNFYHTHSWDERKYFSNQIKPGETIVEKIPVELPKESGLSYRLEVSIVHEGVAWLHDLGLQIGTAQLVKKLNPNECLQVLEVQN